VSGAGVWRAALLGLAALVAGCGVLPFGPSGGGTTPRVRTAFIQPSEPLAFAVGTPVAGAASAFPEPPARNLAEIAQRYKLPCGTRVETPAAAPEPQAVGARREFQIFDFPRHRYVSRPSTLRLATSRTYWYVQDGINLDANALAATARVFEDQILPTTRRYFGEEPPVGPDGDARITVWIGPIPGAGGYFGLNDLFPRVVAPTSNERKIIYLSSSGPAPNTPEFFGELAHEYQHLVLAAANPLLGLWAFEGFSELAMKLNGYAPFPPPEQYADQPDLNLTGWAAEPSLALGHYAAAYLFLSYLGQRLGGYEAMREILRTPGAGAGIFNNYLQRSGRAERFNDLVMDWMVANYINTPGLDGNRYTYEAALKLPANDVVSQPASRPSTVQQFGVRYIDITTAGDLEVEFQGLPQVRLFPADPHSGRGVWWSNRGDQIDTTLTRSVDLSAVGRATLRFWTWYDLEQDLDYAYLAVSADDGCTWQTLATRNTVTANPGGNNLGNGFTGSSGGTQSPRWVEQTADLTPWAGKRILLRFESITDEGYNLNGFAVDDLSIPEINWSDGAETEGDWQARGFVRTGTILPQPFGVRLIRWARSGDTERPVAVEPITLDGNQFARLQISGMGRDASRLTLVVTGLNRETSEAAQFRYSVRPRAGQ
jgi:hypothetical protein